MCDYAQAEFRLDVTPKDSKSTIREHLTTIWEQTGFMPAELDLIPPSPTISYLLQYFYELCQSRQIGMTVNPLSFTEVDAWMRLSERPLEWWEIEVIKRLDVIWLKVQNE
nr:MAG TPA: hypothetical protein [Caudoviricetes sp.]DAR61089.1 MAG TPA: hypothetical protein [Caudoviricetes sp.]